MTKTIGPGPNPSLTVIVPARNEAHQIAGTLGALIAGASLGRPELIVVDGGSRDQTPRIASDSGATVIYSKPGRAKQMNAGAAVAGGDHLLFLHADTLVPRDYDRHIRDLLVTQGVACGAFQLVIDGSHPLLRLVERGANLRSRLLSLPYGDQGLFMRAEVFRRLGGFADMPLMEDYDLVRRLRGTGRVRVARASVRTSARRWRDQGIVCATMTNVASIIAYQLGVSPQRVAAWRDGFCAR